jgi:hypothetical protein
LHPPGARRTRTATASYTFAAVSLRISAAPDCLPGTLVEPPGPPLTAPETLLGVGSASSPSTANRLAPRGHLSEDLLTRRGSLQELGLRRRPGSSSSALPRPS